jgi:branched-chain amino acid transport system permease protein
VRFDYHTEYGADRALLRYWGERWAYGVLLAALLAAPFVLSKFYVGELTYLFIVCIASLGLMVVTGYTGQISLGHAAFLAIGGYAHALLLAAGVPFLVSLVLAGLIAGAAGAVVGLPAIRTSGLYLAMVTLAFAVIVEHVIGRWKSLTGGFSGVAVAEPSLFVVDLGGLRGFYYFVLVTLILVLLGLVNLMRSRTGRAFVAVRDSEAAAYGLGVNVAGYKLLGFVISAAVCGLAGALLAHHLKFLTPEAFNLMLSLELVLMVVIGGLGSLRGAILGAILIGLVPPAISALKPLLPTSLATQSGVEIFIFGLVLVCFVLFEPAGLYGRWLKIKRYFEYFPLYRRNTFRRVKSYMRSERYR